MDFRYIIAAFTCLIVCAIPSEANTTVSNTTIAPDGAQSEQTVNVTEEVTTVGEQITNSTMNIDVTTRETVVTVAPNERKQTTFPEATTVGAILNTESVTTKTDDISTKASVSVMTSTQTVDITTKAPSCMKARAANFTACFEALGDNAMKYLLSQNLEAFLEDICDANKSRPYMECIKRHFTECPEFQHRPEVEALQFGPYHIKDIIYFSTVDQMCACAPGLICIQELIKMKKSEDMTSLATKSPWEKLPNYHKLCQNDTVRYIGCVRRNLRRCQSPLTVRYQADFTDEDAENIKRMYDFTKEHCEHVKSEGFQQNYACIKERSISPEMNMCIRSTDRMAKEKQICRMRDCVTEVMEPSCNRTMVALYIDAVNIYRYNSPKLLNFPCSGSDDIDVSILALFATFVIVLLI